MSSWIKRGLFAALVLAGTSLTAGTAEAQHYGGHYRGVHGHYGYEGTGSTRPSYSYNFSYRTPSFSYSYSYGNAYGSGYAHRHGSAPRYSSGRGVCR